MGRPLAFTSRPHSRGNSRSRGGGQFRLPRRFASVLLALAMLFGVGYAVLPTQEASAVPATQFHICRQPPHADCVIDGDTFYLGRQSIRVADIDTPEIHPARCPFEADLGARATGRLFGLLNAGPFTMQLYDTRDADRYGRKLRVVLRDGRSLGAILVDEGLARAWTGARQPWCG